MRFHTLIAAGALLAASLHGPASAAPAASAAPSPGLSLLGPDHYSFTVGDVRIIALSDGSVPQDLHALLRNTSQGRTDALLSDSFLTNPVEASINAFLVLVDTGAGGFFGPGFGDRLVSSLAAIAVTPEQITDILLTHAHDDHMGGLVHGGRLTFPNATVHLAQADLDFFMDREISGAPAMPCRTSIRRPRRSGPASRPGRSAPSRRAGRSSPA